MTGPPGHARAELHGDHPPRAPVPVAFAHESEQRFAALLDSYGIEWRYEPHTFVLERDDDGNVRRAFTPDFFLPEFGTYVEITTLRQKLVTKKNRKIRQFRATHPDIDLVVLYQRDMAALFARHGMSDPAGHSGGLATVAG